MGKIRKVNHFKGRVEVECAKRGISLTELGNRMGASQAALSGMLNYGSPSLKTLKRIAVALQVNVAILLQPVSAEEYGKVMRPQTNA